MDQSIGGAPGFGKARWGAAPFALMLAALPAALPAAPLTRAVKLDNFGYRSADAKVAIVTSDPGPTVQVRTAAGQVVFTVPTDGGSIVPKGLDVPDSGDEVWWVDFSGFTTPGTYHLYSPTLGAQSYDFLVGDDVYDGVVRAALKSFYYQRCGVAKTAAHAGAWADAAACHTADAATTAAAGQTDHGPQDLSGGWHDAGDYNKYVWGATGTAVLFLLRAVEDNPGVFADGDLGIPESGNGVPDVLDEVQWELEWLRKMQLPAGSVLSQIHVPGFGADAPPSADLSLRYYYDPGPESNGLFTGTMAVASRVFAAVGMTAYAQTLRSAALAAWAVVQGEGDSDEKVWAAAEVFRMDPAVTSARTYVDGYHAGSWNGVFFNVMSWDTQAALAYVQTLAATPAVVGNMRQNVADQVNYVFSEDDLYRNGMPDWSYYWGSNEIRAGYGVFLMTAARLGATGSRTAAECRAHALDFLHFFHGQNTLNMVYLTSMASRGGEHSSWQLYHAWFGDSDNAYSSANHVGKPAGVAEPFYPYFGGVDNHGVSDDKTSLLGPAPGFVSGGPNAAYSGTASPPAGSVYLNRFYRDWNDQSTSTAVTWEITENSIGYQGPYVALGSYFMSAMPPPGAATSFYTLTPCRAVDTRAGTPAPLAAGSGRTYTLAGMCQVPAGARAVSLNVTATGPTAGGNLRLYPAGLPLPTVATVNYGAGQTRGNNAIVPLNGAGQLTVHCAQATGTAHVILDVNGYFQ